jgi:hypothetical protein
MINSRTFSRGLQKIFSEQPLLYFLVGTIAVAVLGNAVYQLLTNIFGEDKRAATGIAAGSVLILLWASWHVGRIIKFGKPINPIANESRPIKRKGLILLVSKEETCRKAIEWHQQKLEHCWLICSQLSKPVAKTLKDQLEDINVVARIEEIKDAFDPIGLKEKVDSIYENLPANCQEADVILDFTGMTVLASVGSVLACLDESRAIQYVPAEYNDKGQPVKPLDPIEIVLTWSILHLSEAPTS